MPADIAQAVLWCRLCNKPFNNDASLKRHGYYCRARKTGSVARKRSCFDCARAKVRCNGERPQCARCESKRLQCQYRAKTTESANKIHQVQTTTNKGTLVHGHIKDDHQTNDGMSFAQNNFDNSGFEGAFLEWDALNVDPLDLLPMDTALNEFDKSLEFGQSWLTANETELLPRNNLSVLSGSIPPYPSNNVRWLLERPGSKSSPGYQRMVTLTLGILKSYPLTMLRHGTNPPFIHPFLMSSGNELDSMEPLNNCISLMHMISKNVRGSRKLFWRNVRAECEQWLAEYVTFDKWRLLACMQALLIYTLLRIEEGETDDNNLDYLLLATVVALAKYMAQPRLAHNEVALTRDRSSRRSWLEWLFEESARRLCVVYRIMNLVVYFEPALLCDLTGELILAPLPSKRTLWEAQDDLSWEAQTVDAFEHSPAFGLAANGDLVNIQGYRAHCYTPATKDQYAPLTSSSYKSANWEEWCSGMDSFGSLVMLTAALVVDKP